MSEALQKQVQTLNEQLSARVVGQPELIERLLIAIFADGHLLLQGPPGVAKTRAAFLLAKAFDVSFQRIQFTPDLLPSDLTGTSIYDPGRHEFTFQAGPVFHDFILADEINRAPAKVQAALLEAMAERQVTVGGQTRPLSRSFFVIGTQNPIEEEGTYELPVAQLDRFLMRVVVKFPPPAAERQMLDIVQAEKQGGAGYSPPVDGLSRISANQLQQVRQAVLSVHLSSPVKDYIVRLVHATRPASAINMAHDDRQGTQQHNKALSDQVANPVSPRGTLALAQAAQARAWLHARDHVLPEDVQNLAGDVLAHRLSVTYQAQAQGIDEHDVVNDLLNRVTAI